MKALIEAIDRYINFSENMSILGFKGDGLKRLLPRKLESNKKRKYEIVNSNDISPIDALKITKKTLIILDIDALQDPLETISKLNSFENASIIFLSENPELFQKLQNELSSDSVFFDNTIIVPIEVKTDREEMQNMCFDLYGTINSSNTLNKIYKESGGHFEIYKRLYKSETTSNEESFDIYVKKLVKELGSDVLRALRNLVNKVDLSIKEKESLEIYEKLGFLEGGEITIPILKKYIVDESPREKFELTEDGQLIISNLQEFSKSEMKVVKTLLENSGEVVTKEELGFVVWGQEVKQKYSPWAIDQIMFRIRNKLERMNVYGEVKTVHGKGYILNVE
jgi:hypothetical protein